MPVAKSYQKFKIDGEPYKVNNRLYVKLETGKQVRWYSDAEYNRMYPQEHQVLRPYSHVLGFIKGYILLVKGDTLSNIEWLRAAVTRYNRCFGWFLPSECEIPEDTPKDLEWVKLEWEEISSNDTLKPELEIRSIVESKIFEQSPSNFVGEVGDTIEVTAIVKKVGNYNGTYGFSYVYTLEDDYKNIFVWFTTKSLTLGNIYTLKGRVKDHKTYKNEKQTFITRCQILGGD